MTPPRRDDARDVVQDDRRQGERAGLEPGGALGGVIREAAGEKAELSVASFSPRGYAYTANQLIVW